MLKLAAAMWGVDRLVGKSLSAVPRRGIVDLLGTASEPLPLSAPASNKQQVVQTNKRLFLLTSRDIQRARRMRSPSGSRQFLSTWNCVKMEKESKYFPLDAPHYTSVLWFLIVFAEQR